MMPKKRIKGATDLTQSEFYKPLGNAILSKIDTTKSQKDYEMDFGGFKIPIVIGARAAAQQKVVKMFPQVYGKTKTKNYDFVLAQYHTQKAPQALVTAANSGSGPVAELLKLAGTKLEDYTYCRVYTKQDIMDMAIQSSPRLAKSLQWYALHGRQILNAKVQLTVYCTGGKNGVIVDYDENVFKNSGFDKQSVPVKDRIMGVTCGPIKDYFPSAKDLEDAGRRIQSEYQSSVVTHPDQIKGFVDAAANQLVEAQTRLSNISSFAANQIHNVKIGYFPLLSGIVVLSDKSLIGCSLSVKFWYKNTIFEPYLQFLNSAIVPKQIIGGVELVSQMTGAYDGTQQLSKQEKQEIVLKASAKKMSKLQYSIQNAAVLKGILQAPYKILHFAADDWQSILSSGGTPLDITAKMRKYNKGLLRSFQAIFNSDPLDFKNQMLDLIKDPTFGKLSEFTVVAQAYQHLCISYNSRLQGGASDEVTKSILLALRKWLETHATNVRIPTEMPRDVRKGGNPSYVAGKYVPRAAAGGGVANPIVQANAIPVQAVGAGDGMDDIGVSYM